MSNLGTYQRCIACYFQEEAFLKMIVPNEYKTQNGVSLVASKNIKDIHSGLGNELRAVK